MRRLVGTTRLLEALDSLRRRLVGASVGGLLAATVLPAALLAVVEPQRKGAGPLDEGSRLALPVKGTRPPASFAAIERRETIEGHLTPADIRRALIASRAQRQRILRAHPNFWLYKQAERRYGVSWYLVAALHDRRREMSDAAVMTAARGLRKAGAGSHLDRGAWRALIVHFGGPRAARTTGSRAATTPASRVATTRASLVLERARAWKQLGVIPLPVRDKVATPVEGVVPGCGYFHCPRPGHLHNGLDLSAPAGTPIHAVQAGRVAILEDSGASGGYGRFVCLQHAPALASCYAHLSRFAPGLAVGREIGRGEVIGQVGCSGHCFGDHLHFEIRRGPAGCAECAVDPVPYLSGKVPDLPPPALGKRASRSGAALRPAAPAGMPAVPAPGPGPRTPASAPTPQRPRAGTPDPGGQAPAGDDDVASGPPPPAATRTPAGRPPVGTAPSRQPGRQPPAPQPASPPPAQPPPSPAPAAPAPSSPPPPSEAGGAPGPPPGG